MGAELFVRAEVKRRIKLRKNKKLEKKIRKQKKCASGNLAFILWIY